MELPVRSNPQISPRLAGLSGGSSSADSVPGLKWLAARLKNARVRSESELLAPSATR